MHVLGDSIGRWRHAALVVPFALAVGGAAVAATVGGGYFSALGEGRIVLAGSGFDPVAIPANFRFDFDGAAADTAGTGTVYCYDPSGQFLVGQFPYTWTTKRGASFKMDLNNQDLADFLAAHVADATGGTAAVTLESASGKGALRKYEPTIPVRLKARGTVSLDGSEPMPVKVKVKLR